MEFLRTKASRILARGGDPISVAHSLSVCVDALALAQRYRSLVAWLQENEPEVLDDWASDRGAELAVEGEDEA